MKDDEFDERVDAKDDKVGTSFSARAGTSAFSPWPLERSSGNVDWETAHTGKVATCFGSTCHQEGVATSSTRDLRDHGSIGNV